PWSKSFPGTVTLKHEAQDVAKAIRWVHDHARDYGGDPAAMVVMGHSAGAHLSALVCTEERYLKAEGLSLAKIKGCVPIDGDSHYLPMHMKANAGKKVAATDRERFGEEDLQKELSRHARCQGQEHSAVLDPPHRGSRSPGDPGAGGEICPGAPGSGRAGKNPWRCRQGPQHAEQRSRLAGRQADSGGV